jgi:hypothetical protein
VSEQSNRSGDGTEQPGEFERHSKALFDESVENLDGHTRSRLTQARHAALAVAEGSARRGAIWRIWLPAGSVAAALLAVMLVVSPHRTAVTTPGSHEPAVPFDDMEIVANGDDETDMLENVEFYSWLDTQSIDGKDGEV